MNIKLKNEIVNFFEKYGVTAEAFDAFGGDEKYIDLSLMTNAGNDWYETFSLKDGTYKELAEGINERAAEFSVSDEISEAMERTVSANISILADEAEWKKQKLDELADEFGKTYGERTGSIIDADISKSISHSAFTATAPVTDFDAEKNRVIVLYRITDMDNEFASAMYDKLDMQRITGKSFERNLDTRSYICIGDEGLVDFIMESGGKFANYNFSDDEKNAVLEVIAESDNYAKRLETAVSAYAKNRNVEKNRFAFEVTTIGSGFLPYKRFTGEDAVALEYSTLTGGMRLSEETQKSLQRKIFSENPSLSGSGYDMDVRLRITSDYDVTVETKLYDKGCEFEDPVYSGTVKLEDNEKVLVLGAVDDALKKIGVSLKTDLEHGALVAREEKEEWLFKNFYDSDDIIRTYLDDAPFVEVREFCGLDDVKAGNISPKGILKAINDKIKDMSDEEKEGYAQKYADRLYKDNIKGEKYLDNEARRNVKPQKVSVREDMER